MHVHAFGFAYTAAGRKGFVRLLIARGTDIEAKSDSENTPLHYAAAQGKKDVIGVLLQNNANVSTCNINHFNVNVL